jgi:release factor glutamine methyltransferase
VSEPQSIGQLLDLAERVLKDSTHIFEDHDNRREAEELLAFCLGRELDALDESEVPGRRVRERYLAMVARRAAGEPFPFLTGRIEFYGLDLEVRPGPFVPRPSSELTVARAVKRLRRRKRPVVVDVCAGTGPIALAIADELPRAEVWAADIDSAALRLGRRNARALGIDNVAFRHSDMYSGLPRRLEGTVDVITGHIPYVPADEIDDLPTEVRAYEPVHTLSDRSPDGLGLIRRAADEASRWLKPGGWLLIEVSPDLPNKVGRICRKAGLSDIGEATDEDDLSVVVEARAPR